MDSTTTTTQSFGPLTVEANLALFADLPTPHRPKADRLWRLRTLAKITNASRRLFETDRKLVEAAAYDHGVKVSDLWAVDTLLNSHLEDEDFNDLWSYLNEAEAFGSEDWFE